MNSSISLLIKKAFAKLLTLIFFGLALMIILSLLFTIVEGVLNKTNIVEIFLSSVNTGIIALAVFELALVIDKEYSVHSGDQEHDENDTVASLRRTLPRFIGTVCVALSLEGLIMVIKYSQLELAGNLYYPVAIITSTALLLSSLGLFIFLTNKTN